MTVRALVTAVLGLGLGLVAAAPASAATTWLCKPGQAANPCVGERSETVVAGDGTRTTRAVRANPRSRTDCFYVYPTVTSGGLNAPLAVQDSITGVAGLQARPFSRTCRVYAPLYRQLSIAGIGAALDDRALFRTAYGDVRSAWREYLRRYNRGRGVVLIGHSQGTAMLRALIREEIDRRPAARQRLVSALLIGGNVRVRRGRDAGGDFRNVRACRRPTQTGCVVAYSTYDATPPADAIFTRPGDALSRLIGAGPAAGLQILCTNPAALRGGAAPLRTLSSGTAYPGLYTARCRSEDGATWLGVTSSPADPRASSRLPASLGPSWGLHLFDVTIAAGDLVALVARQGAAHQRRSAR